MSESELPPDEGPREGESLHEWMARRQNELLVEAAKEPMAYVAEISAWVEAHPDATFKERCAALDQIKQKYPRMVEHDRVSQEWEDWKDDHPTADFWDKEAAFERIWGCEADEDDYERDPEFWEYDPDARTVGGPMGHHI